MFHQTLSIFSPRDGVKGSRYVEGLCLEELHYHGIIHLMGGADFQIGMEAIGRVRKVKKKVKDTVERLVENVHLPSAAAAEETNGTSEAQVDTISAKSEQTKPLNAKHEQVTAENNSDVNNIMERMDNLQVSRDIQV